MAKQILTNAVILWDQYDLSNTHNRIALSMSREPLAADTFSSSNWRVYEPGVMRSTAEGQGFWDIGGSSITPDSQYSSNISGTADAILTLTHSGGTVGDACYFTKVQQSSYEPFGGSPSELLPFAFRATGVSVGVRGIVLARATRTGTYNETGQNYGVLAEGHTLYAAIHVSAFSGTTATVVIQSDDNAEFTGATTRVTFTNVTAATKEWKTYTTATTDTYWRAAITAFTGTSMTYNVVMGII